MRDRAWRRAQNQRVINKRKKIIKDIWCADSSSWTPDDFREFEESGRLNKFNFTCDHECCKIDKNGSRIGRRQKDRDYERSYMLAFRSHNFST
jgi:hypothetical protein